MAGARDGFRFGVGAFFGLIAAALMCLGGGWVVWIWIADPAGVLRGREQPSITVEEWERRAQQERDAVRDAARDAPGGD